MVVDWQAIGYRKRNVTYFSYDGHRDAYKAAKTTEDLHRKARDCSDARSKSSQLRIPANISIWSRTHKAESSSRSSCRRYIEVTRTSTRRSTTW